MSAAVSMLRHVSFSALRKNNYFVLSISEPNRSFTDTACQHCSTMRVNQCVYSDSCHHTHVRCFRLFELCCNQDETSTQQRYSSRYSLVTIYFCCTIANQCKWFLNHCTSASTKQKNSLKIFEMPFNPGIQIFADGHL